MNNPELIWNASMEDLKRGYAEEEDYYMCLCCGEKVEKGIIYPDGGILYEAGRYVRVHIEKAHHSVFEHLIRLDKSLTGLTDVQKNLLEHFYLGHKDSDIQKELGIGSTSTIRNHRFLLREKERQAKVFLTLMELLKSRDQAAPPDPARQAAGRPDDRAPVEADERDPVLKKYFPGGTNGPLKSFPKQMKHRRIVLGEIAARFGFGRTYTEEEVNEMLEAVSGDYVTLRRFLIEYGFLDRKPDGSSYWLKETKTGEERNNMDRKQELKELSKEIKTLSGIFQIKNTRNEKIFIESSRNLKTMNGQQFQLEMGSHPNKVLQREWNEFGKEAFAFEVLEVLEKKEGVYLDEKDALKKLKDKWLERLQPFGERGYNPS